MRRPACASGARLVPIVAFVVGLVWLAMVPSAALAHAELAKADPAPGASLAQAPARIDLWFTERLTNQVSSIQVYDGAEHRVDRGDAQVDRADARHLSVDLEPLPPGTYTVVWSNLSSDDGHPDRGGYAFTLLAPRPSAQPGAAVSTAPSAPTPMPTAAATAMHASAESAMAVANLLDPASDRSATVIDLIGGWVTFGALVIIAGGACFSLLCLLPALRRAATDGRRLSVTLNRRFALLTALCSTVGGGAALVSLLAKDELATGLPANAMFSFAILGPMLSSAAGHAWIGRELVFACLLVAAAVARWMFATDDMAAWSYAGNERRVGRPRPWPSRVTSLGSTDLLLVLIAELAAIGLVFQALSSHLAAGMVARNGPLGTVTLCLHLLAAGLWVGGLAYGALLLWPVWRRLPAPVQAVIAGHAVARFSPLALASVAVITVTGTYAAVLLLPAPRDLLTSAYGQALDVKVALLLVLVLFGAANRQTLARIALATRGGDAGHGPVRRLLHLRHAGTGDGWLSAAVSKAGTRLIRAIRREFAVAAAVLLAAATMLEVGPPSAMPEAPGRPVEASLAQTPSLGASTPIAGQPSATVTSASPRYVGTAKSGDLLLQLRADPTLAGATSTITVNVATDNGAPTAGAEVKLWLTAQTLDMGTQVLTAKPAEQGMYQVVAPAFAAPGNWQVLLVVRRDNVPEVDQHFTIPVQAPPANTFVSQPTAALTPVPDAPRETLAR